MSRKLSTNNNISSLKEGSFPAAFHGLCLLLFSGTVPDLVTPLFPLSLHNTPRFSRLPSLHAPAFPPAQTSGFSVGFPALFSPPGCLGRHAAERGSLCSGCGAQSHGPPQTPSWSCSFRHPTPSTLSQMPQLPKATGNFNRDERGHRCPTFHLLINFPKPGQSVEVLQLSNQLQIIELFIHFLWAHFPSQPYRKSTPGHQSCVQCWDPLLWQQKDTWGSSSREFPGAKTKPSFVPASTEQCAGGASSHRWESRAVVPIWNHIPVPKAGGLNTRGPRSPGLGGPRSWE